MTRQIIDVSFWTIFKVAFVAILLWALWLLRDVIGVLLLSVVIASSIEPINHWFSRHRVPRVVGVVAIYLAAFFFFILMFYLILPPLFNDLFNFTAQLPNYIEEAFDPDSFIFQLFPDLPLVLR